MIFGVNPLSGIIDSTDGHDVMNMGMGPKLATPGVKNTVKTNGSPKTIRVMAKIQQGAGRCLRLWSSSQVLLTKTHALLIFVSYFHTI